MIIDKIGRAAMYEQLAEECSELAQAALKKARIIRGENPTNKTMEQATADVTEEYSDVIQCANELRLHVDNDLMRRKRERFVKRWNDREKN